MRTDKGIDCCLNVRLYLKLLALMVKITMMSELWLRLILEKSVMKDLIPQPDTLVSQDRENNSDETFTSTSIQRLKRHLKQIRRPPQSRVFSCNYSLRDTCGHS